MKLIFSPQTLMTIEKVGAFIADAHVKAAEKLREISWKIEDRGIAFLEKLSETVQFKCFNFREASRKFAARVKATYAQRMMALAKHQAAARHERLAWVALEKTRLETEAEVLENAWKEFEARI